MHSVATTLTTLEIRCDSPAYDIVARVVQALPRLTSFDLRCHPGYTHAGEIWRDLARLAPELLHLRLEVRGNVPADELLEGVISFLDVLSGRDGTETAGKLRDVILCWRDASFSKKLEYLRRVQQLKDSGLHLTIMDRAGTFNNL